jgi:hypothetical protein
LSEDFLPEVLLPEFFFVEEFWFDTADSLFCSASSISLSSFASNELTLFSKDFKVVVLGIVLSSFAVKKNMINRGVSSVRLTV